MVSFCGVAWLIRSQALTVLPVLSSLKALRQLAKVWRDNLDEIPAVDSSA